MSPTRGWFWTTMVVLGFGWPGSSQAQPGPAAAGAPAAFPAGFVPPHTPRAAAQQQDLTGPIDRWLSVEGRSAIGNRHARRAFGRQLRQLEKSGLPRPVIKEVLSSPKAAPYLRDAVPRLTALARVPGIEDVAHRLARGGQSGAYELAVAHAFRGSLRAASGFEDGNEVDGLLTSGTILESKSGRPKRPHHVVVQARRRAQGGHNVALVVNYHPSASVMRELRQLSREMDGRVEVHYVPLTGNGYRTLVSSRKVENPNLPFLSARPNAAASLRNLCRNKHRPGARWNMPRNHTFRVDRKRGWTPRYRAQRGH